MAASSSTTVYDSNLNTSEHPRFALPTTPSRSPYKDAGHRRSPTKLLRPTKVVPDYDEFQALLDSDVTTAAEKGLASRVVRAAEKLKEWCAEIERWGWSGSFESSPKALRQSDASSGELEFCGSLPQDQVEVYESRLDNIDDELTALEVDELKEQILGIHVGRSRPSSSYSTHSFSKLTLYDDFQLFVTETLIHTLPYHAKVKQYLKAWSTRLAVLVEIPSFLRGSSYLDDILNQAWYPLQYPLGPMAPLPHISQVEKQLTSAQDELREKVDELGKQLDRMLDALEESEDRLPEQWIDKFEKDEKEYTDWCYEADKKLFELRMLENALTRNENISAFVPGPPEPESDKTRGSAVATTPIVSELIASTPVNEVLADNTQESREVKSASSDGASTFVVPESQSYTTTANEDGTSAAHILVEGSLPVHVSKSVPDALAEPEVSILDKENPLGNGPTTEEVQSVINKPVELSAKVAETKLLADAITDEPGSRESQRMVDPPELMEVNAMSNTENPTTVEELPIGSDGIHVKSGPRRALDWESDEEDEDWEMIDHSMPNVDSAEATTLHYIPAAIVRRASVTSIESFTRDKVKTVTLSRRNSVISNGTTTPPLSDAPPIPQIPIREGASPIDTTKPKTPWSALPTSPLGSFSQAVGDEAVSPKTPIRHGRPHSASSVRSSVKSDASGDCDLLDESPLMRVNDRPIAQVPRPPLNFAMRKRRGIDGTTRLDTALDARSVSTPFSDVEVSAFATPLDSPSKTIKSPLSPRSPAVPLEEQISNIVESQPFPIRFRSGPYATNTAKPRDRNVSGSMRSRASTPTLSPLPTLTLAPAEDSSARKAGANDPEIKIYNLISGKDKPIKLFVRRVGENGERVMVRVGGGWADLGEYLRSYAEHHGRRAASDGRIEVVGIGADAGVNATTTPTSRRGSLVSSIGSSALAGTLIPSSGGRSVSRSASPALVDTPTAIGTPKFNDDFLGTPQTAGSAASGGSRRTSTLWEENGAGSTGLMGPAVARKKDQVLSEEKMLWVEGVVEQAKRTVGRNVEVGDLGKKGGTRRVFLKGKSGE